MKTLIAVCAAMLFTTGLFANNTPKETKEELVADWERARDYTLEYIDAMPEDGINFSPTKGIRTFAEQMLHIANANVGIAGIATGKQGPFSGNIEKDDKYKNKAALKEVVTQSYNHVIATIKEFDMSKAEESVQGFGGANLPRIVWMRKNFEHQTHHRGQTTIYLRMKGVKPPPEKLL